MAMTTKSFFLIFGADAAGIVIYGLLFGRNACKCTARGIKVDAQQRDVNLMDEEDASAFDPDDPIRDSLVIQGGSGGGSVLSSDRSIEHSLGDPVPSNGLGVGGKDRDLLINSVSPREISIERSVVTRHSTVIPPDSFSIDAGIVFGSLPLSSSSSYTVPSCCAQWKREEFES